MVAHVVYCYLTAHKGFLFCCGDTFMNFPSANPKSTHTWLYESNQWWITLRSDSHLSMTHSGAVFWKTGEHQTYGCGHTTRQFNRKVQEAGGGYKQHNTFQENGWIVSEIDNSTTHNSIISLIQTLYWHVSKAICFLKCDVAGKPQQTQK